jgi:hypothetical protein
MKIVYSFKAISSAFICFEILARKIENAEHPCIPETVVTGESPINSGRF